MDRASRHAAGHGDRWALQRGVPGRAAGPGRRRPHGAGGLLQQGGAHGRRGARVRGTGGEPRHDGGWLRGVRRPRAEADGWGRRRWRPPGDTGALRRHPQARPPGHGRGPRGGLVREGGDRTRRRPAAGCAGREAQREAQEALPHRVARARGRGRRARRRPRAPPSSRPARWHTERRVERPEARRPRPRAVLPPHTPWATAGRGRRRALSLRGPPPPVRGGEGLRGAEGGAWHHAPSSPRRAQSPQAPPPGPCHLVGGVCGGRRTGDRGHQRVAIGLSRVDSVLGVGRHGDRLRGSGG